MQEVLGHYMPGEGHGVLIAPLWFITAAHTISGNSNLKQVVINGVARDVERVVMHSGYKTLPQELIDQAMASGEAMLIVVFLASSDDIALVKLTEPVTDVAPVAIYKHGDEAGRVVKIVGKGATGTGAAGHDPGGPNRTELRRAFNEITSAYGRWFCHVFDEPPSALPLEGTTGNGDSGGPALIQVGDQWLLAGLASWKVVQGDVRTARPGRYGQTGCNVRLSHYIQWIEGVISEQPQAEATSSFEPNLRQALGGQRSQGIRPRRAEPAQRIPPHVFRVASLDPHPAESPAAVPPYVIRPYLSAGTLSEGAAAQSGAYMPLST